MDRKKIILLVGALFVALVTALMARSMFRGTPAPRSVAAPVPQGTMVLVAKRALPLGTIVTADSYSWQPWPDSMLDSTYFVKKNGNTPNIGGLAGSVVRHTITAGQPITQESLVAPGDRGFLAAALSPGMRAITIPVTGLTGVAGFVYPGDRVDLVLTQKIDGVANSGPPLKVSETIIRDLRVLATDNRVVPTVDDKGHTIPAQARLVTLEATPRIAEKVTVAQTLGTISLSLRSLADSGSDGSGNVDAAIASGQLNVTNKGGHMVLTQADSRPEAGPTTYETGGDVSRFQRRSVPEQTVPTPPRPTAATTVRISRGGSVSVVDMTQGVRSGVAAGAASAAKTVPNAAAAEMF